MNANELSRYGKISIFNFGEGWICKCEMFVIGTRVKVEIASERGHPHVEAAIDECLGRCKQCIAELATRDKMLENQANG